MDMDRRFAPKIEKQPRKMYRNWSGIDIEGIRTRKRSFRTKTKTFVYNRL